MNASFNSILNKWFVDILKNVDESSQTKQRHKKVMVSRNMESVALRQPITDVTFTYSQNRYPNANPESVVAQVLGGSKGEGITRYCMVDSARATLMLKARQKIFFVPRPSTEKDSAGYDVMIADFKDSFYSPVKFDAFLRRLGSNRNYQKWTQVYSDGVSEKLKQEQLDFLIKVYIPPSMRGYLQNTPSVDMWKLIELIRDSDLRNELLKDLPNTPEARAEMDKFLNNRVASFGADLAEELKLELQHYFPNADLQQTSNMDKCLLTLFYNIKKALSMVKDAPNQGPFNITKLRLLKGINRTKCNPQYKSLVRTERSKIAARRAVHMYSSGLKLITKGINGGNTRHVMHGYSMIYNIESEEYKQSQVSASRRRNKTEFSLKQSCPLFAPDQNTDLIEEYPCDSFRLKECAASAVLLMYMELMDYMVSPAPPLLLKRQMRVTAAYVHPGTYEVEDYDVNTYNAWPDHKRAAFRKEYQQFLLNYMNVGFTITDKFGPHGMPLLNLDSWGKSDLGVVPNPFRVREDTFLFKYFGSFRLEYNRLGIGQVARNLWLLHTVKQDYDPKYAGEFVKHSDFYTSESDFPRPVFDINFYDPEKAGAEDNHMFSNLYFNVSSICPYAAITGPIIASARRTYLNKISMKRWVKLSFGHILTSGSDFYPSREHLKGCMNSTTISREAEVCLNIHRNFRSRTHPLQMPFRCSDGDITEPMAVGMYYDESPGTQLYRPIFDLDESVYRYHKQGIEYNKSGWEYWLAKKDPIFMRDQATQYMTGYSSTDGVATVVSRTLVTPPPPLFNRFLHPVLQEEVPIRELLKDTNECEDLYREWESTSNTEKLVQKKCLSLPHWVNTNRLSSKEDHAFPYPIDTLAGHIDSRNVTFYPCGKSQNEDDEGGPPFSQVRTSIYVIFPKDDVFWDLRSALVLFMKNKTLARLVSDTGKALRDKTPKNLDADVMRIIEEQRKDDMTELDFAQAVPLPEEWQFGEGTGEGMSTFELEDVKVPAAEEVTGLGQRSETQTWFYIAPSSMQITRELGEMHIGEEGQRHTEKMRTVVQNQSVGSDNPPALSINISPNVKVGKCKVEFGKIPRSGSGKDQVLTSADQKTLYLWGANKKNYHLHPRFWKGGEFVGGDLGGDGLGQGHAHVNYVGVITTCSEPDLLSSIALNDKVFAWISKQCASRFHLVVPTYKPVGSQEDTYGLACLGAINSTTEYAWVRLQKNIVDHILAMDPRVAETKFAYTMYNKSEKKSMNLNKVQKMLEKEKNKLTNYYNTPSDHSALALNKFYRKGKDESLRLPDGFEIYYTGKSSTGYGIRTTQEISKEDYADKDGRIGYYSGKVLTVAEFNTKYGKKITESGEDQDNQHYAERYVFRMGENGQYIDAAQPQNKSWARFINAPHSTQEPNVKFYLNKEKNKPKPQNKWIEVRLLDDLAKHTPLMAKYDPVGDTDSGGGIKQLEIIK